jgi:hypothetical protein
MVYRLASIRFICSFMKTTDELSFHSLFTAWVVRLRVAPAEPSSAGRLRVRFAV